MLNANYSDHAIVLSQIYKLRYLIKNGKMSCLIDQGIMTNIDENGQNLTWPQFGFLLQYVMIKKPGYWIQNVSLITGTHNQEQQ